MKRRVAILLICLSLCVLFTYAAVTKLADYSNFRFGISESPFIGPFAGMLAWMVPASELAIVILLAWPRTRLTGLYASFFLMLLFSIFIAAMLISSSDIPCSCGGVLEEMSWPVHLLFNSLFVLLAAIGILLERKQRNLTLSDNYRNLSYAKRYPATPDAH